MPELRLMSWVGLATQEQVLRGLTNWLMQWCIKIAFPQPSGPTSNRGVLLCNQGARLWMTPYSLVVITNPLAAS